MGSNNFGPSRFQCTKDKIAQLNQIKTWFPYSVFEEKALFLVQGRPLVRILTSKILSSHFDLTRSHLLSQENVYRTRAYLTPYYFRKRELCSGTYRDLKPCFRFAEIIIKVHDSSIVLKDLLLVLFCVWSHLEWKLKSVKFLSMDNVVKVRRHMYMSPNEELL